MRALVRAVQKARLKIFKAAQGSKFTNEAFTSHLKAAEVAISMEAGVQSVFEVLVAREGLRHLLIN